MRLARRVAALLLVLIAVAAFAASAASLAMTRTVLDASAVARDAVAVLQTPSGVVLVTDIATPRVLADLQSRGVAPTPTTQARVRAAIAVSLAQPQVATQLRGALEQMQRSVAASSDSGPVVLDLAPLRAPVQTALAVASPRLALVFAQRPMALGAFSLGNSASVRAARRLLQDAPTLRRVPLAAFLFGVAAFLLALVVAQYRRWLLIGTGAGLTASALMVSALALAAPSLVRRGVPAVAAPIASDLAHRAFASWWQAALLLVAIGMFAIAAGFLVRPRPPATQRAAR